MSHIVGDLVGYAFHLFFVWIIWQHYQGHTYLVSEKYDTFAPRFWTGFVDSCVLWPVTLLISLPISSGKPSPIAAASTVLFQNLVWLIYSIWMHAQRGQTVGKIVCKIRVVDHVTEGAITVRQAVLRESIPLLLNIGVIIYQISLVAQGVLSEANPPKPKDIHFDTLWLVSVFPLLWFVAEIVTMFSNKKRRALHDFLAGTSVVRTNVPTIGITPLTPIS